MKKIILCIAVTLLSFMNTVTECSAEINDNSYINEMNEFYEIWKSNYIVQDKYVTDEEQYYVWYSGETYNNDNQSVPVTVSEAHGYGMLITVNFADYDSDSKKIFDGMYRYYKSHTSDIGENLMSWQQSDNGSELIDGASDGEMTAGECDSATDGDMDIAYSLLIADSVWGSDGEIDYKSQAVNIINDIMEYEVNKTDWTLQLGDWVYYENENSNYYSATRASDFIMQYMPVFAEVSGDKRWLDVYDSTYDIINSFVDEYETGLIPDFIIKDAETNKFIPAPEYFLEDKTDGLYGYNSCRTPWRISMDYLVNGNETAGKFANVINNFIINKTDGNPENIMAGYTLNGESCENYNDLCFTAPFLVSAKCSNDAQWSETLWQYIRDYGKDVYYGDTIKMLCMMSYCNKWSVPETSNNSDVQATLLGDVNCDGTVDVVDVTMLKQSVIKLIELNAQQSANANVIADGTVDVKDLGQLIKYIIKVIDKF